MTTHANFRPASYVGKRNPLGERLPLSTAPCFFAVFLWGSLALWKLASPPIVLAQSPLQARLKTARPGDVVTVPAGVHKLSLNVPGGVILKGAPGAIIDATGKQDGIHVIGRDGGKQVMISGLEIFGSTYGVQLIKGAASVTIKNCRIHDCDFGIWIRDSSRIQVTDCEIYENRNGVSFYNSGPGSVEKSEIHHNEIDGVLVTFHSHDIRISENSIHHHVAKSHPDAIQTHNHVERLRITGNLMYENGQALHSQQTDEVVIEDNLILGTLSQALVIGKGDTTNVEMRNNLIAYTGHIAVNLTASGYEFFENTIVTGGGKGALSYRGASDVTADRNLYWGTNRQQRSLLVITDRGFYTDFNKYRAQSTIDRNSVSRDPKFAGAPVASSNIDAARLEAADASRIPVLRSHLFRQGDIIEIGFDGVPRRVQAIAENAVLFDPPLSEKPSHGSTILIWGRAMKKWDLGRKYGDLAQRLNKARSE